MEGLGGMSGQMETQVCFFLFFFLDTLNRGHVRDQRPRSNAHGGEILQGEKGRRELSTCRLYK